MISINKLAGREVIASCLPGVTVPLGTGLSGAVEARPVERERGSVAISGRPTQAPAAVAMAAAQASAYALAANGADLQQKWTDGGFAGFTTSAAEQHHTMRAFRGLEPWRDPA
ncbi:hypothetical protein ABZW18_16790 [Streptomyces sp. NPDC004647]|uniref:hypothetical protein n=1 Tax=Streptomyces sp. NPDC004647 TaxID=3154671 RepID=UPI0033B4396B